MRSEPKVLPPRLRSSVFGAGRDEQTVDAEEKLPFMLFDLIEDPSESNDLAAVQPDVVKKMKTMLLQWRDACRDSRAGRDYD